MMLLLELQIRRRRHRPWHSRRQEEVEVGAGIGGMRGPAMGGGGQIKQVGSHSSCKRVPPLSLRGARLVCVESLHSCV